MIIIMQDIVFSLTEEKSVTRTRHDEFVKSMFLVTMDLKPNSRTDAGKILAELLSKKTISMAAVIKGYCFLFLNNSIIVYSIIKNGFLFFRIDAVLKDWNDYLVDYPQFFSYIAAIIGDLYTMNNFYFYISSI